MGGDTHSKSKKNAKEGGYALATEHFWIEVKLAHKRFIQL